MTLDASGMRRMAAAGMAIAALLCARSAFATSADPLEGYYDNTLVCASYDTGVDQCHTWFFRDGTLITFDASGGHEGRFTIGPKNADGTSQICQYWNTDTLAHPKEMQDDLPSTTCTTENFRTTCKRGLPASELPERLRKLTGLQQMALRFKEGMCYPLGPHKAGDVWIEEHDPLGANGKDKLMIIEGHR